MLARLGAKPRLRMLTKYRMLLDKMEAREVVKQAIAEYGYLPTRKHILKLGIAVVKEKVNDA